MARKRDRVFALTLAFVFFFTAFGFTFFIIWQSLSKNNSSNSPSTPTAAQQCANKAPTEPTYPIPVAYIPPSSSVQLQITDLSAGTGTKAIAGECLTVKYDGTLANNGTVFDENFDKNTGFSFQLGAGQVIKGWDEGLIGMKVGGTRRLVIPAALAYGSNSPGPNIPANSNLVFIVKLLAIN